MKARNNALPVRWPHLTKQKMHTRPAWVPRQYRRDLSRFMHLHENYPIKRAGVAGRALRAEKGIIYNYSLLPQSSRVLVKSHLN
ncbi:hypothetical protein F8E53_21750, partial [Salmonella enterica]|nr:hypothetical protein [Salmonella enterica]